MCFCGSALERYAIPACPCPTPQLVTCLKLSYFVRVCKQCLEMKHTLFYTRESLHQSPFPPFVLPPPPYSIVHGFRAFWGFERNKIVSKKALCVWGEESAWCSEQCSYLPGSYSQRTSRSVLFFSMCSCQNPPKPRHFYIPVFDNNL